MTTLESCLVIDGAVETEAISLDKFVASAANMPARYPSGYVSDAGVLTPARILAPATWTGALIPLPTQEEYTAAFSSQFPSVLAVLRAARGFVAVGQLAAWPISRSIYLPEKLTLCLVAADAGQSRWRRVACAVGTFLEYGYKALARPETDPYMGIQHSVVATYGIVDVFVESPEQRISLRIQLEQFSTVADALTAISIPTLQVVTGIGPDGELETHMTPAAAISHMYRRIQIDGSPGEFDGAPVDSENRTNNPPPALEIVEIASEFKAGYALDISEGATAALAAAGFHLISDPANTNGQVPGGKADPKLWQLPRPEVIPAPGIIRGGFKITSPPTNLRDLYMLSVHPDAINPAYPNGFPVAAVGMRSTMHNISVVARNDKLESLVWVHIGDARDVESITDAPEVRDPIAAFGPFWEWDGSPPTAGSVIGSLALVNETYHQITNQCCGVPTSSLSVDILMDYFGLAPASIGTIAAIFADARSRERECIINFSDILWDARNAVTGRILEIAKTPLDYWLCSGAAPRFERRRRWCVDGAQTAPAAGPARRYDPVCPICLGATDGDLPTVRLPCGHEIHRGNPECDGIEAWLKKVQAHTCPTCAQPISPKVEVARTVIEVRGKKT